MPLEEYGYEIRFKIDVTLQSENEVYREIGKFEKQLRDQLKSERTQLFNLKMKGVNDYDSQKEPQHRKRPRRVCKRRRR